MSSPPCICTKLKAEWVGVEQQTTTVDTIYYALQQREAIKGFVK